MRLVRRRETPPPLGTKIILDPQFFLGVRLVVTTVVFTRGGIVGTLVRKKHEKVCSNLRALQNTGSIHGYSTIVAFDTDYGSYTFST